MFTKRLGLFKLHLSAIKNLVNILLLSSSSDLYGASRIFLQTALLYKNEGINILVVLPSPSPLRDEFVANGVDVRIKNLGILRRKYINPAGMLNRLDKNIKAYRYLNKLHKEYAFDLIYSSTLSVVIGALWAKMKGVKHIWHNHEILPGPRALVKFYAKLMDSSTPFPIAVSQSVANHWAPFLKKSSQAVIHNGISYTEFLTDNPNAKSEIGVSEGKLLITMIGRINPGKGQLFFLKIAKEIHTRYPNAHFALIGSPFPGYEPIHEEIKSFIVDNKLESCVDDLGFREDIARILQATDIFVLPSVLPDSFPTVILEAMASGKPVVATRSGGAVEMVLDGQTGFLIPIGDVKKGAEVVEELIKKEDLRIKFGKSGRERVLREYSVESFEEKIKSHLWLHLKKS